MFAHNVLAAKFRNAGVSREQATRRVNAMFAKHGHFSKVKVTQTAIDAYKELAYW